MGFLMQKHFETKIESERSKEKKKTKYHKKAGDTVQSYVSCTSITLRAYPFGIICSTSHSALRVITLLAATTLLYESLLSRRRIRSLLYSYVIYKVGKYV